MISRNDLATGVEINYKKPFNIPKIFEKDPFLEVSS